MTTTPLRAVIITAEAFEDEEVMYPVMRLHEEGIVVDIATKGAKEVVGRLGFPLELLVRYYGKLVDATKLEAKDYDFVLLPGGFEAPDRVRQMPQVLSFVQSMHRDGKIVAAFCHGPWILISAGLVEGKTITGYVGIKDDITNAGATYVDEAVVVDGNIITSRHPRDIGRFMKELLRLLGLLTISISPCAVEPLRRYDMNPRHPNPEKMPNPSNVGRRIRTDDGREGVIRNEWVDGDDCSGSFGYLKYSFDGSMNNSMSPNAHNCVFLD